MVGCTWEATVGGEIIIRASMNIDNFDPYFSEVYTSIYGGWMERKGWSRMTGHRTPQYGIIPWLGTLQNI